MGNDPNKPRNFRDRYNLGEDDFLGAADAADRSDNNSPNNLGFGDHAAGYDYDQRYDQPYNPAQPGQWQPTQPTGPYPQQQPPQPDAYRPAQYPPQGGYPPQPSYPPQQPSYPPQQPYQAQGGQPAYPPQQPYSPQQYPQQPPASPLNALPPSAQELQNRLAGRGRVEPRPTGEDIKKSGTSQDGFDKLFDSKGLPCAGNTTILLMFIGLSAVMVCVMAFLALGSLDRHLGLGIF